MIVRCNNCVSAFAVDDEKVADRKFAFTCPKCNSENIIDNRVLDKKPDEKNLQLEESYFNDDFSIDTDSPDKEKVQAGEADDIFFDEAPEKKEESFDAFEDEIASEFPADDIISETGKKDRNLNLEIEESLDFPEMEEEDIFAEKPTSGKKEKEEDLSAEIPAFETEDEFISFDEKEKVKAPSDEFGIELKDDIVKTEDEDIFFDDFDEIPEKPEKKESSPKEDILKEEIDFEFEDIDTETTPAETDNEREKKLSSQDDIDALFAEEGIEFDEKPISKESEIAFEDEITVDLDMLDIELEEIGEDKTEKEETLTSVSAATPGTLEEDITLDIDNLDIDLEETSLDSDIFDEPVKTEKRKDKAAASEEDITLDIDNLDIDLDETSFDSDIFDEPVKADKRKDKAAAPEEDITLDIDNLDIDLEETSFDSDIFDEPVKADKRKDKAAASDEDITLDIDNLDIDLEETSFDADIFNEPAAVKSTKSSVKKDIVPEDDSDFNEEDIKLNLDDLDIDLEEIEERELIFEDDIVEKPAAVSRQKSRPLPEEDEEDESITIDLDTLEIEIAESSNALSGELSEEDEKLTLDDAGLTFDELTSEMDKQKYEEPADEDLKLTLDDIDPELTLDRITRSADVESELVTDTLDELPEIDLDEYDAIVRQEESRESKQSYDEFEEDFVVFPETENALNEDVKPEYDIFDYEESEQEKSPAKGSTFFSIDFSLKYSRIGALLRLLGLYMISMIPHFVVMLVYTVLSSILGFINQIVILSTGRCVEDFAQIIENTMRYFFYIKSNITGIVEDRPVYAGREYIDHPLQLNITYPLKYSKNLALLRLSIVGISLITLPHLIIMSLFTMTIPVVYLAGIITVIITRRWPNILFIYLTKYFRYLARISSFMTGLTDEYPPFSFD